MDDNPVGHDPAIEIGIGGAFIAKGRVTGKSSLRPISHQEDRYPTADAINKPLLFRLGHILKSETCLVDHPGIEEPLSEGSG